MSSANAARFSTKSRSQPLLYRLRTRVQPPNPSNRRRESRIRRGSVESRGSPPQVPKSALKQWMSQPKGPRGGSPVASGPATTSSGLQRIFLPLALRVVEVKLQLEGRTCMVLARLGNKYQSLTARKRQRSRPVSLLSPGLRTLFMT